jgi:phosphatidate phosphatase APP1
VTIEPAASPATEVRLHRAARIEDAAHKVLERRLLRRGWHSTIVAYPGYGLAGKDSPGWVRVMGRVLLARAASDKPRKRAKKVRGWRSFASLSVMDAPVVVEVNGVRHEAFADRGGFIDLTCSSDLPAGWTTVRISSADGDPVDAPVNIVDPAVRFGILSDIDDTVMVTALPRPLLAGWNTFVLDEFARASVPGMSVLYERLSNAHPGAPVIYLSTGSWNVAPALTRFLSRHLYPAGPLLLTDWGPTKDSWFRSGRAHKEATLRRLAAEFPDIRWLLIGDDGQHDPEIYAEFVQSHPANVAAVAIRRLSPTQSVLAGVLPTLSEVPRASGPIDQRWLSAPDGAGLAGLLREAGLL